MILQVSALKSWIGLLSTVTDVSLQSHLQSQLSYITSVDRISNSGYGSVIDLRLVVCQLSRDAIGYVKVCKAILA